MSRRVHGSRALLLSLASSFVSALASAQAPPPASPGQPPYYPPPYAYPPQPYSYPPPPPYAPPPPTYQPPEELPYREGAPIPVGYHREERPRKGLVVTGWVLTGIPYGVGLIGAASAEFGNASGWLAVPYVGPWLTMGRRDYHCEDSSRNDGVKCVGDIFLVMGLIMDGVMQAAGGTLLVIGYTNPKTHLIRNDAALHIRPLRVGSGHGFGVAGSF